MMKFENGGSTTVDMARDFLASEPCRAGTPDRSDAHRNVRATAFLARALLPAIFALGVTARAAIVVPGANGSDGNLNITNNTVIDLSLAATNVWDCDNSAYAGKGVYDSNKWAVVFKYTNVNIAAGATVTFKNHPSRAPVVWLVSGDVVLAGTLNLNGQTGANSPYMQEPGPGGFRGGTGSYGPNSDAAGNGPGGGTKYNAGSYGTVGTGNPYPSYGNPSLVPLVGGSGGGGYGNGSGGGGGGAILIACANSIQLNGLVVANGGIGSYSHNSTFNSWGGAAGSGGGVRIVSESLSGAGTIQALGGVQAYSGPGGNAPGGNGRIRIERVSNSNTGIPSPAPSVVDLSAGATAIIWPPTNSPEVRVVSIGGVNTPSDPRAAFGTYGSDVALPVTNSSVVVVETKNVEAASQVKVRITPRDTYDASEVSAAVVATNSLSPLTLIWNATVPAQLGYSAVQVKVIRP